MKFERQFKKALTIWLRQQGKKYSDAVVTDYQETVETDLCDTCNGSGIDHTIQIYYNTPIQSGSFFYYGDSFADLVKELADINV